MFVHVREFLPFLESSCPDADNSLLRLVVVMTCMDFCQKTHIHQETLSAIAAVDNQASYPINLPPYVDLCGLRMVYYRGNPLNPTSPETLDRNYPNWQNMQQGLPLWYHQDAPKTVRLIPAPGESLETAIAFRVALQPSPKAQHVWQRLYQDFHTEIIAGALAKLCGMPKKPWTDKTTAAENMGIYVAAIRRGKALALKQFTNESIYVERLTLA